MQDTVITPIGAINKSSYQEASKVAGFRWDKNKEEFVIITSKCEHWKLNTNDQKKTNEAKWYKAEGYLPIRFYNFQYALKMCRDDIGKAVAFAKERLFDADGLPIYLPDELSRVNQIDPNERRYTYNKILSEGNVGTV